MECKLEALSFDDMVDALANVQRRKLLTALLEHNPQDDAPVVITDSDNETDAVKRPVTMRYVHLPKLVDYGMIEWNEETHKVAKGPQFDEIRPLLELLADHEDKLPADWV
jgi:predicted transcriptional regulator